MKLLKSYFTKKFFNYHLKWQVGFVITTPLLYLFIDVLNYPYWLSVLLFQAIGALIFWPIDSYIFRKQEDNEK